MNKLTIHGPQKLLDDLLFKIATEHPGLRIDLSPADYECVARIESPVNWPGLRVVMDQDGEVLGVYDTITYRGMTDSLESGRAQFEHLLSTNDDTWYITALDLESGTPQIAELPRIYAP